MTSPPPEKLQPAAPKPKPKGPPWSEQETTHLIRAYRDKWYSLKRGLLRAHQWDAVALSVSALCGLDAPSKSGVQCRHKMEKLRKRYRDELQRHPAPSRWPLFPLMDRLERGSPSPPPSSSSGEVASAGRRVRPRSDAGGPREIAEVMMRFEEGFLRIEKRRMEIVREFERDLMELESRRAEMAFESRRCLAEVVDRLFRSARDSDAPPDVKHQ